MENQTVQKADCAMELIMARALSDAFLSYPDDTFTALHHLDCLAFIMEHWHE